MELNNRMATNNPRGKLNLPLIKIINECRSLLTRIISNSMLHLPVKLLIHGVLGGSLRVNCLLMDRVLMDKIHMDRTPLGKIPMGRTLMGQAHPDKVHGGNHHLVGTLVLPLSHSHKCPLTLSCHS